MIHFGPSGRMGVALFWTLLLALCLLSANRGLWTPDEPREAEIGREMYLAPGFVPELNGKPFFEKPPLYYWALSCMYAVTGGPSAWGARLLSGLAAFLTLLLTYLWARRSASPEVAGLAVFMLATSAQFFLSAHWVIIDPLLMLLLTAAGFAAFELLRSPRPVWLVLFYGALALAVWTKGLVALAVPFAGLLPLFVLVRKTRPWRNFRPVLGGAFLALFIALVLAAFYFAEGQEALRQLVWVNHVQRFLSPSTTGHAQPFYHYLQDLPLVVLPWFAPFMALFRPSFWKGRFSGGAADPRVFLLCLVAGPFALLSLASTKREIYLLPLLPPLFILVALALREALESDPEQRARWARILFGAAQPIALAAWGLALPSSVLIYTRSPWSSTIALLLLAAMAGLAGLWFGPRGRLGWAWEAHRVSAVLFCVAALTLVVPILDAQKDMAPFAAHVDALLPPGADVPTLAADETLCGIIPFVTGRRVSPISGEEMDALLKEGRGPAFLLQRVDPGTYSGDLGKAGYRLLQERRFGTGRILRLWGAAPRAASEATGG